MVKQNWLDSAIQLVSPKWGLQRARTRAALQHFRYEGARTGRRTDGWSSGASDANVELAGSLVLLRDRSRDLIRNNPYAVKVVEELVGSTVGTGILPQAKTGDQALDKIIDSQWPYFAEKCDTPQRMDFYAMQALVMRTMVESGDAVVRFRPRPPGDNLPIPLQLQVLEADFLDHQKNFQLDNGWITQGVQFDLIGRRVAYWLFNFHPGGNLIIDLKGGFISNAVPAEGVMHTYRVLRPGQVRGVPHLAPVMMALRDLDDYGDAERLRKKIEACLTGIVTKSDNDPLGSIATDADGKRIEGFEPGMIAYLNAGEAINITEPKANGGYREYTVTELQRIASGTGISYEQIASDMSQTTYTSYRAGQLGFRNTIETYRWLTLIPMFCQPTRKRFIDTLVLMGKIPEKAQTDPSINLYSTNWTAPKWESVDPWKDSRAEVQKIRTGTNTLWNAIAENGYDPRAQFDLIAETNAILDARKIVLDSDPRAVNIHGVGQPMGNEEIQPGQPQPAKSQPTQARKAAAKADALSADDRNWTNRTRRYTT
jgi:lambda family phage portal protein